MVYNGEKIKKCILPCPGPFGKPNALSFLCACRAQESSVPVQTYVVVDAMSGRVLRSWRQENTAHAARRQHIRKVLSDSTTSPEVAGVLRWVRQELA